LSDKKIESPELSRFGIKLDDINEVTNEAPNIDDNKDDIKISIDVKPTRRTT